MSSLDSEENALDNVFKDKDADTQFDCDTPLTVTANFDEKTSLLTK